jgi:hypothetical protein
VHRRIGKRASLSGRKTRGGRGGEELEGRSGIRAGAHRCLDGEGDIREAPRRAAQVSGDVRARGEG